MRELSMPKLESIKDRETLQQAALLLEKTVVRQSKEIARLRAENARLRGQDISPQMELELLREQLAAMQQKLYGPSSEKRPHTQDDAEGTDTTARRGHGPRSQPDLPMEEITHTLPEAERMCSICGQVMVEMGEQAEESEEITVVGVEYKILKHRRQKYRCRCNEQVMTAPGPAKHIPGGRYSVDFAVHVAEQKYLDHLPTTGSEGGRAFRDLEWEAKVHAIARECGLPITRIGTVTAAAGLVIQRGDGSRLELAAGGYQHFDASPGAGS